VRQLRASGQKTGNEYDLEATMGGDGGDGGVPAGRVLLEFAEAALGGDENRLTAAQAACRAALGDAALVDAAAVVSQFNAIVRVADATGMYLDDAVLEETAAVRAELGIDTFLTLGG
jgi:hypothetical protein